MELAIDLGPPTRVPVPGTIGTPSPPGAGLGSLVLTPLQRAVLATDGTLSTLIEAYTGDTIAVRKLHDRTRPAHAATAPGLQLAPHDEVLERTVLLSGANRLGPIIFAVTQLVLERLEAPMREALLTTDAPIGKLLLASRTETFRELIDIHAEPAGAAGSFLAVDETAPLLVRTYRIVAGDRPLMTVTEKFPYDRFLEPHHEGRGLH
jgi:chorismate-pyruvate lyase